MEMLEYERKNSQALQSILLRGSSGIQSEETTSAPTDFKPTRPRRVTWQQKRQEVERANRREEDADVRRQPELTEAEKIFENSLKAQPT